MTDENTPDINKIEEEIRRLEEIKAKLKGSGTIVQGDESTAIGQQGVGVKGSVSSSLINTGTIFHIYQSASGMPRLHEASFERILSNYLEWLRKAYGKARLYGLESIQTGGSQKKRELSEVFVPLSLQRFSPPSRAEVEKHAENFKGDLYAEQRAFLSLVDRRREDGEAIPTESLLIHGNRLAVIGGAGSGKSTLLAYLAAMFAEHELTGKTLPIQLPKERKTLVPLVIPLRYRREYLRLCNETPSTVLTNVRPGTIAGFVLWYLKKRSQAIRVTDESLAEEFFDRLLLGGGCLVMLDGLDEVVSQSERGQVRTEVERLAEEIYPDNLFIVTARESGYKENAIFSEDFIRLDVQALQDEQIQALVHNWCEQLYPNKIEDQVKDILQSINSINRRYEEQGLPALVRTPLMTTMVVSVKWGETELPRERARLYEAVVKVILQAQYLDDDDQTKELVNWGGAWEEQREWLSYLALEMHRGGQNSAAIPEVRLREILAPKLNKENLEQFIQAVRSRGGLLEERAELFQFAHLTFQEFLAARLLAKDREKSLPILEECITDAWWREVVLLVYGFSKQDYAPFSIEYLSWLSNRNTSPALHLAGLELAGAAMLEIEKPDARANKAQADLLLIAWRDTSDNLTAPAIIRARAGKTLSQLGDPRFNADLWYLPVDETLGFVRIPAGKFLMGSDDKDKHAREREKPQHEVELPDYWIAKYPVTVAQYRSYEEKSGNKRNIERSMQEILNHPIVAVTWYEALEYTKWLDEELRKAAKGRKTEGEKHLFWKGLAEGKLQATLPSEAEWEKASRGTSGNIYPWGNNFDSDKTNVSSTKIGGISSVGCFPAWQHGLYDMSGNVWEWTRSLWGKDLFDPYYTYPYEIKDKERENFNAEKNIYRILRGGSFDNESDRSRCACRNGNNPVHGFGYFGFRVVVSPIRNDEG